MPRLIAIEGSEAQRRQLSEQLKALEQEGYSLAGKFEARENFSSWRTLFERAQARGLFAERQILVSEGSEVLGPFPDELAASLEDRDAVSVIVAAFSGDTKKIFPKGSAALSKIFFVKGEASVPPWKRKDWLMSLAGEQKAVLKPDAAALLGETVESQEELRGELAKLILYAGGRDITVQDVRTLSFDEGGRAQLAFLDGVCQARPRDVARSLKHLRRGPVLPVLTSLCNRLRPALYMAVFPASREAALRAIGMGTGKDYALRMAGSALSLFGAAAIKKFMLEGIRLSFFEKTSLAVGWPGFELALWDLMGSAFSGEIHS